MSLNQSNLITLLNKAMRQQGKQTSDTEITYVCPFHTAINNVDRKKFGINLSTQEFNCFACGTKGRTYRKLFKRLKLQKSFFDELAEILDYKSLNYSFHKTEDKYSVNHILPEEFLSLTIPTKSIHQKNAISYLRKRNVTHTDLVRYNIGYCEEGKYRNRIIIPSYDVEGNLNFFTGRDFYENSTLRYLNCDFDKNIIGFESLVDFSEEITLVEGPMDAISIRRNSIPLFGKFLSEKLKIKLIQNRCPLVNVLLDDDAQHSVVKICDFLLQNNTNARIIKLNEKDASKAGFEKTWRQINLSDMTSTGDVFKYNILKGMNSKLW